MYQIVTNGLSGTSLDKLIAADWDPGVLRPYRNQKGQTVVTLNQAGRLVEMPVQNANTTLPHEAWKVIDTAVMRAARPRLKAVADVRAAGLTRSIPNAMGKTVLYTQRMTDPGSAIISMDPVRDAPTNDRPEFDGINLPLPIIHSDFNFSARDLEISRSGNVALDTTMAESASRRVAEEAEKLLLGRSAYNSYNYGGGVIYGYLTFAQKLTATITAPTDSAWTPEDTVDEVSTMLQAAIDKYHYGPFQLYFSKAWTKYLGKDYVAANAGTTSTITLRERLAKLEGISAISTLDYLGASSTDFKILLVEMNSDVVQEVIGFDITTVQWEEKGGLKLCFKVMAMLIPLLRADINGNTGIVVGSTA